ncbi:unnamed protein product (macronuclear) [Paramecium tetraurelia]|uniref:CCHC-type domain-containing protein n=1 Tax=Paramecium tetraurelia TaxID=5888 RepID=A0DS00_PARTE|nr:uncharacterized protein GSPATT00019521001 [Paramecium tetraurelia]CAK85817.1 unnamed protein product [Paramecium tetraurelia]|eukprot:XP_001453214.1 hypothetical protein (macronuclear) [Paramecium tetraurelia strain d4-2]
MMFHFEDSSSESEEKEYQFEKQPIINKEGVQNIKVVDINQYYELFDATKKSTNEAKLLQKLKGIQSNKEVNWYTETDPIQQQSSSSEEGELTYRKHQKVKRYFDYKYYQFCWNCRQHGHQTNMCEVGQQPYCLICLSLNHSFYDCELKLEKGNLNFDVQTPEAKCLNCLDLGHTNCRFNNIKQQS